jgi:sirohydrochlorin cobaltochelatase
MPETTSQSEKSAAINPRHSASLLIVAHGERGGAGEDRLTKDLVERLGNRGRFEAVAAGFIRSRPSVSEARDGLPEGPVRVYPLFMSAGYYVATAIPRDLGIGDDGRDGRGRPITILRSLGLHPRLPAIIADLAAVGASAAALEAPATTVLLVAHGSSKDDASRQAAVAVATEIEREGRFARVETAFLEEPPFIDDALRTVPGPAVVVGLFVGEGMHGGEDLPRAVEKSGRDDVVLGEPLGRSDALIALICEDAEQGHMALSEAADAGIG